MRIRQIQPRIALGARVFVPTPQSRLYGKQLLSVQADSLRFGKNSSGVSGNRAIYIAVSDIHLKAPVFSDNQALQSPDGKIFAQFLRDLKRQVEKQPEGTKLVLVLNGDILDILASWGGPPYPWEWPDAEAKLQQVVRRILGKNQDVFQAFRALGQLKSVEMHYISGNHDPWLCHSEAQQQIREAMGISEGQLSFHEAEWAVPGVALFTHGHTIDGLSVSSTPQAAPWGDYVTMFFINRYLIHLQKKLRLAGYPEATVKKVMSKLDNLDHLPLFWDAPGWQKTVARQGHPLDHLMKAARKEAFQELSKAVEKKLNLAPGSWQSVGAEHLLQHPASFHLISWIASLVEGWVHTNRSQKQFAQKRVSLATPNIVMGHSHAPKRMLLKLLSSGDAAYYLNSGTWKRAFVPPNSLNRFLPFWHAKDRTPYSRYVQITQTPSGFLYTALRPYNPAEPESICLQEASYKANETGLPSGFV